MAVQTRAKFRCNEVKLFASQANARWVHKETGIETTTYPGSKIDEFNFVADKVILPSVVLSAITPEGGWTPENKSFWEATPSGTISITIQNPDAAEVFEVGEDYYVDFTPAK